MKVEADQDPVTIESLHENFERYDSLLETYARSQTKKVVAEQEMATALSNLNRMATALKETKESDYHRVFVAASSVTEAEDRLKTTLRLTALANEIIVLQAVIEAAVALYQAGDAQAASGVHINLGKIAEIADRIGRIEQTAEPAGEGTSSSIAQDLGASTYDFLINFDDYQLAVRDQARRATDMAGVAAIVTNLIQNINDRQTSVAVDSSNWTTQLVIVAIAFSLCLGGIVGITIRSRISHPLSLLIGTMNRMSAGQLELTVPCKERRDELGAVAQAIEVFRVKSLEARHLAQQNIEVERRLVAEQTEAEFLAKSLKREKEVNAQQRQFVAMVSHEFRTPLAIIDGIAQRVIRKGDKLTTDDRNDAMSKSRGSVARLISLIENFLSAARLEAGSIELTPAPMDLQALVQEACDNQQQISDNHEIKVEIEALPQDFVGDAKLLRHVIANLLSNAVKYSPHSSLVEVMGAVDHEHAVIAVRDHGVGIPQDEISKLFERFFRASTSLGIAGTGLGLNLVKAVVDLHGGDLSVTSVEGESSTFKIKLPLNMPLSLTSEAA